MASSRQRASWITLLALLRSQLRNLDIHHRQTFPFLLVQLFQHPQLKWHHAFDALLIALIIPCEQGATSGWRRRINLNQYHRSYTVVRERSYSNVDGEMLNGFRKPRNDLSLRWLNFTETDSIYFKKIFKDILDPLFVVSDCRHITARVILPKLLGRKA